MPRADPSFSLYVRPLFLTLSRIMVTSNHVHVLAVDDGERDVIPNYIQLIAGYSGQDRTGI